MTPQEMYLDMLTKTRPIRGVNVREVAGGYAVVGSTRYADLVTGGIQHEASEEGVAMDAQQATSMAANYLQVGAFVPPAISLPLFDTTPTLAGPATI